MRVQFEWQAEDENGEWETIATLGGEVRPKVPRWGWAVALVLIVVLAGGGTLGVRRWHGAARRRIAFQIQSVIDLERRALARHDFELFMAQQDVAAPEWVAGQAVRARVELQVAKAAAEGCERVLLPDAGKRRADDPAAHVEKVELRGDVAWVEVIAGREPVRQARFYRQTDLGWLHTAPDVSFWGEPLTVQYGNVVIRCHERDLAYVEPLVKEILSTCEDVGATFNCPLDSALEIDLAVGARTDELAAFSGNTLTLASPWLYGVPVEGRWSPWYLEELRYWAAYAAISRFLHSAGGGEHDLLQRAITAETATWYGQQDAARAPLLRRVLEQHGTDALPEVLRALREPRTFAWFAEQWLSLSPSEDRQVLFETLLNVEQEALLAGQRDTFLLLQDRDPKWMEMQEAYYEHVRSGQIGFCHTPAQVQGVEMVGDHVLVTLNERTSLERAEQEARSLNRVGVFYLQDGVWRRSWRWASDADMSQVVPAEASMFLAHNGGY